MNASQQSLDLSHKVHKCIGAQQWHPAKHHLQRLLALDPKDAQAHQLLGLVHVQLANLATTEDLRCEHRERALLAFQAATQHGPDMFDAFLNLGNTCLQTNRPEAAVEAFRSALQLQPDSDLAYANQAEAYKLLHDVDKALEGYGRALQLAPHKHAYLIKAGNLLRELNRHADAVTCYEQAIQMEPDHAEAYAHMAIAMSGLGHVDAALGCCQIALQIDPHLCLAYHHRALLELQQNHLDSALVSLNAALEQHPRATPIWEVKGLVLTRLKQYADAIGTFDQAVALGAHSADLFQNRAQCHKELQHLDQALNDLETALAIDPRHPNALMALGVMSQEMGRNEAALGIYTQIIEQCPDKAEAYSNLGAVLFELSRYEDSFETLQVAIDLDPQLAIAWSNLGATLTKLYRYEAAVQAFVQVQQLDPSNIDALAYQGLLLHDLNRLDEAMECYDRALSLDPDHSLSLWHRAVCLLLQGDFKRGWPAYEARWQHKRLKLELRKYPQPRWDGQQSLEGQHLLVYAEQGLGDTLQFARFIPQLVQLGARVSFEVQPALKTLIARCLPQVNVFATGESCPAFDLHTPLLSIPGVLHCDAATIPSSDRYLSASDMKCAEWKRRLGTKTRPRVGLVWSGNPAHQNDRNRSIRLQDLLCALPDDLDYICLQNHIRPEDQQAIGSLRQVQDFTADLKDFEDTAALCQLMDLVISVDTSVAHLSAALGKTTWTLIPASPDWRWTMDRTDTPWYDSMRLIRQAVPGSWQHELTLLSAELLTWSRPLCSLATPQQAWSMATPLAA